MEFRRDLEIVRNGALEATNYFFAFPGQDEELELTFNHDGRTYDVGTGYGHVAIGVDDLDGTLARLAEQGIEPERPPYQVRERRQPSRQAGTRLTRPAGGRRIGADSRGGPRGGES